ncbi:MAG: hypothetical protein IJ079_00900 [Lachnospiraceae bacterium]|nr:hypothetical protein [Lachnospiraceae bacterium]
MDNNNEESKKIYYTKTDLRKLGFTDSMFKAEDFPKPCDRWEAFYGGKKIYYYVYDPDDINDYINSNEAISTKLQKNLERREKQSKSLKKTIDAKYNTTIDYINSIHIHVKREEYEELRRRSLDYIEYRRCLSCRNSWDYDPRDYNIPKITPRNIVNTIRHELTEYDDTLAELFKKIGKKDAYHILIDKTYDEIKNVYPEYAKEIERQRKEHHERV